MGRYEGPINNGMRFTLKGGNDTHVWTVKPEGFSVEKCEQIRGAIIPVRPNDDDRAAWELFKPRAPLPRLTERPRYKSGDVIAVGTPAGTLVVLRLLQLERGMWTFKAISGHVAGGQHFASESDFALHSVLLFPADAPATTEAPPAARKLAPGWKRANKLTTFCDSGCGRPLVPIMFWKWPGAISCCADCAPLAGIFAKDEPVRPDVVADPSVPRDEVQLRNEAGEIVARVVGIREPICPFACCDLGAGAIVHHASCKTAEAIAQRKEEAERAEKARDARALRDAGHLQENYQTPIGHLPYPIRGTPLSTRLHVPARFGVERTDPRWRPRWRAENKA